MIREFDFTYVNSLRLVGGSFFRKLYTCIAFKITQPRTFLTGARKSHFNHTAHKVKSKPRETDCGAGLHMWEMMSDNGFNLPSSLWLQGSFLADICAHSAMFSKVKLHSLYRAWNKDLLSKVERNLLNHPSDSVIQIFFVCVTGCKEKT